MLIPAWFGDSFEPYRSRLIVAEPAQQRWQLRAYYALRHAVFVQEQALFEHSDRDEHDAQALHLVAMATTAGMLDDVIGVVRIYPQPGDVWYGGRLAVTQRYRRQPEVGSALIRAAVGSARGLGARRFLATVQSANVRYFQRHHFCALESVVVRARPHCLMDADLAAFAVPSWVRGEMERAA